MKYIMSLFFMVLAQFSFGQSQRIIERTLEEQVMESMENYFSKIHAELYITQNRKLQEYGFLDIRKIDADFVLRYCTYDSVIEIIKKEDSIQGTLTFVIEGYENNTIKKVFLMSETLSSQDCKRLIENTTSIDLKVPTTVKNFKDWKGNYHSFTGTLEILKDEEHFFNVYRVLRNQINEYEGVLSNFINSLERLPEYTNLKKRFYLENPYNRYLYWNGYVHIRY